jgi:hypothetical protein
MDLSVADWLAHLGNHVQRRGRIVGRWLGRRLVISVFAQVRRARLVADGGCPERRWACEQRARSLRALTSEIPS